jgi:hypothetical protein
VPFAFQAEGDVARFDGVPDPILVEVKALATDEHVCLLVVVMLMSGQHGTGRKPVDARSGQGAAGCQRRATLNIRPPLHLAIARQFAGYGGDSVEQKHTLIAHGIFLCPKKPLT